MNEKFNELYSYLKGNGMTDLDANSFYKKYSDPVKSKEIYSYLKSNKMTDLDETSFHSSYFGGKKKEPTASLSPSGQKPTSSVTPAKKPQKPSVSSYETRSESKLADGSTQKVIYGDAGKGNRAYALRVSPDGRQSWYEYSSTNVSNGKQEELFDKPITDPNRVSTLNRKFGYKASTVANRDIYTGYPGKEQNEYRVSQLQNGQEVWEVRRKGQDVFTTISDPGSISSLNREFDKSVKSTDDAKQKREAQLTRQKSSDQFKLITGNVMSLQEEVVVDALKKAYKGKGFTFNEVGKGDAVDVLVNDGSGKRATFYLYNSDEETNKSEALKLRAFLQENQMLGDYVDLEKEEERKAKSEYKGLTQVDFQKQMQRLQGAGSQAEFEMAKSQNLDEFIGAGMAVKSQEAKELRKDIVRGEYNSKQKIADLTRVAKTEKDKEEIAAIAKANQDEFVKRYWINDNYVNDLAETSKIIDQKFKVLNDDVNSLNDNINNLSEEEVATKKAELESRYNSLLEEGKDIRSEIGKVGSIEEQNQNDAALYLAYNETRGSVAGGLLNSALKGVFSILGSENAETLAKTLGSERTTDEFMQSDDRWDITKAGFSIAESTGALATSLLTGGAATAGNIGKIGVSAAKTLPFFAMSYNEIKGEMDSKEFSDVPAWQKEGLAIVYGLGVGYLDRVSTTFGVKGVPANIARNTIFRAISGLEKGATTQAIESAITAQFKKDISAGLIKIVGGALVEGATEGTQSLYGSGLKAAFNSMAGQYEDDNGKKIDRFDVDNWASDAATEAYMGALGGLIMSVPSGTVRGIKNGFNRMSPEYVELSKKVIEDSNLRSMVTTDIKTKLMSGKITKEEAKEQLDAIKEASGLFAKMPDNLSPESTAKSFDLIVERSKIEKEISGKEDNLVVVQKERIKEINNELQTISKDAVQKQAAGEVSVQPETTTSEEVVQGKPKSGPEVVTEEGKKEEIDKKKSDRISEIQSILANDDAKFAEEGQRPLLAEARAELTSELEGLKQESTTKSTPVAEVFEFNGKKYELTNDSVTDLETGNLVPIELATQIREEGTVASEVQQQDVATLRAQEQVELAEAIPNIDEYKVDGEVDKNSMPADVLAKYNEIYDKYDKLITPLLTTAQASTSKNQVTLDNFQELENQAVQEGNDTKIKTLRAARMVVKSLPGVKVFIHNSPEEYQQAIADASGDSIDTIKSEEASERSGGQYVNGEIHVDGSIANERTVYHEAFHDAILKAGLSVEMAKGLLKIISDKKIKSQLEAFISQYESSEQNEEMVSELGAIMAEAGTELSTTKLQQFKQLINKLAQKLGLPVMLPASADRQQVVDFINTMSKAIRTGRAVDIENIVTPGASIDGLPNVRMKSISDAKIPSFDTTPTSTRNDMVYPDKSNIEDVLDRSGGAAIFINSDATKVGEVEINGRIISVDGGIDYTFIKENVDDNIGFAASEDAKISVMNKIALEIAAERDRISPEHKGKPVAVFVVVQNGDTMLGEWYAAEYIMEGIDLSITSNKYPGGLRAAKKDFTNAINSVRTGESKTGKSDEKAKIKLTEMIRSGMFDTKEGRLEMAKLLASKEFSFGFRVNLNKELVSANEKSWNSGKNRSIKMALAKQGHTLIDFWNKFMDERFLKSVNDTKLAAEKGSSVSNKTISGFFYNPNVSIDDQVKHARLGIDHAQFNSSFMSEGNFLLDMAYDVNKLFPEMGYPTTNGIEQYNNSNGTSLEKKSMSIVNKLEVSKWLLNNGYKNLVVNPYSSISLSMYTGIVSKPQSVKRNKQLAPNGKPSNLNEKQWNQVRTPAFKKWFGDWENDPKNASKVVDENGEPLVVYHGTDATFDAFIPGWAQGWGTGIYFTDNKEQTKEFGENTIEAFINIKNPVTEKNYKSKMDLIINTDAWKNKTKKLQEKYGEDYELDFEDEFQENIDFLVNIWKELGYDGIIFEGSNSIEGQEIVSFESTQIKSATENEGTFSTTERSIKKSKVSQKDIAVNKAKEKYDLSIKRGNSVDQARESAINDLKKSNWYNNANDISREDAVRDLRSKLGIKEKKSPSVDKITGKPKDKKVIVNDRTALKNQLRLEAKAARESQMDLKQKQRTLIVAINQMKRGGFITVDQASILAKRLAFVNVDNPIMVERFLGYAEKLFGDAEYSAKLNSAFELQKKIKKAIQSGKLQASVVATAKAFSKLNPSLVEDIDTYIENAGKVMNAVKSSRANVKDGVDIDNILKGKKADIAIELKTAMDFNEIGKYTDKAIEFENEYRKNELMSIYKDLADANIITKEMSIEEMKEMIASVMNESKDKMPAEEKLAYIMSWLGSTANVYRPIIKSMLNGRDPFTGDDVVLSEKQDKIMRDFLKIDVTKMDVREAMFVVEAMDNFITNKITDGLETVIEKYNGNLEAKKLADSGVKTRSMNTFGTEKSKLGSGRLWAQEMMSLKTLTDLVFRGVNNAQKITKAMGLSAYENGVALANRLWNNSIDSYYNEFKKTKPNGEKFMSAKNIYERGMYAALKRTVPGNQQVQDAEFKRKIKLINDSISTLMKGSERDREIGEMYSEVAEKLGINEAGVTMLDIESRVDSNNMKAVDWWVSKWADNYSELADVSQNVYNTILDRDMYYTPDKFSSTKPVEKSVEEVFESGGAFGQFLDYEYDKKSGVLMPSAKQSSMAEGRFLDLNFDMNNSKSLKAALVDMKTATSIRKISGFLKSKDWEKVMTSKEDRDVFRKKIDNYILRSRNKSTGAIDNDYAQALDKAGKIWASMGAARALGGFTQPLKQTIPVLMSTIINSGRVDFAVGKDQNDWISKIGRGISNRGLESQAGFEDANRMIDDAVNSGNAVKVLSAIERTNRSILRTVLAKPDVFIARSSFISYYKQYMANNGMSEDINYSKPEDANQDALDYAQRMIDRQQNVSDGDLAGELMASNKPHSKLIRNILLPFASFAINQKSRMFTDFATLMGKEVSSQDRVLAARSLGGLAAEIAVFNAIAFGIKAGIIAISEGIVPPAPEDEKEKEEQLWKQWGYIIGNVIASIISPVPLTDSSVISSSDWVYKQVNKIAKRSSGETKEALKKHNEERELNGQRALVGREADRWMENYQEEDRFKIRAYTNENMAGTYTITYNKLVDLKESYDLAFNGEYKQDMYGKVQKKYILKEDRDVLKYMWIGNAITNIAGFPSEFSSVNRRVENNVKKKSAISEKKFDTYNDVVSHKGGDLNKAELFLVKNMDGTKSQSGTDRVIEEIEWIKENGGFDNERQMDKYIEIYQKEKSVNSSDMYEIKKIK